MSYAIGIVFGALGALWHLAVLWWRARQVGAGRPGRAWAALPLGFAGPVAAFFGALLLGGEEATWVFLIAAIATSALVLVATRHQRADPEDTP